MNEASRHATKINWLTTLFLTITPLVAIIGTAGLFLTNAVQWPTLLLTLFYLFATGLSITCGYHRLYSHKAFTAHWAVRLFFVLFGAAAFEGSVLEWCSHHYNHHRYTDTDKDPYNIKRGFWFAHMGWLIKLDPRTRDFSNIPELTADRMLQFQHNFYVWTAIVIGFLLPMGIASLWGDPLGGLLLAGALRITINQHFTFCINSVCHYFGKKYYSDRNTARDNWFIAFFTYGEGYHNFHHKFPQDYRNGIRWFDFDPTKWLICLFSYCGLVTQLKSVSQQRIIECRLQMDESRLAQRVRPLIMPARDAVIQALKKIDELEKAYHALKQKRLDFIHGKMAEYRQSLQQYKTLLKAHKRELKYSLAIWANVIKNSHHLQTSSGGSI